MTIAPPPQAHDSDGQFMRTVEQIDFDRECAELKSKGMSYRAIGQQLGVDHTTAMRAAKRGMVKAASSETLDEWRAWAIDDNLERATLLWEILGNDYQLVQFGKVVHGEYDLGPKFQAFRELEKINRAIRQIVGVDAPTRSEILVTDQQMTLIADLEQKLGVNDPLQIEAPIASESVVEMDADN